MPEEILYCDAFNTDKGIGICSDRDCQYIYPVENVKGLQVCLSLELTNLVSGDKKYNDIESFFKNRTITNIYPFELFMNKHENDTVEVMIAGTRVVMKLTQAPHNGMKFENRLYKLSKSFGGVTEPDFYKPKLNQRSQLAMFITNHELYSRSVGFNVVKPHKFKSAHLYYEQCRLDA